MKHLSPALALIFTNAVVAAHAGPLNFDPERITVSGISSGAHI